MEDRSGQVLGVAVVFFVLCWIVVPLRVYARWWLLRSFGLDDWLAVALLVVYTVYLATEILGVVHGTGRHYWRLEPQDERQALLWWYMGELLYIMSTCLLKFSVGFFLLRIAVLRAHIWILRFLMMGTAVVGTVFFFMGTFQCSPARTYWEEGPRTSGKCFSDKVVLAMSFTSATINTLADCGFGILPIFIVWSLHMTVKSRIIVMALLSFAAIGSAATVARSFYISALLNREDYLYATADTAIWSTVEPGVGMIAASIATMRPMWQYIRWKLGRSPQAPAQLRSMYHQKASHHSGRAPLQPRGNTTSPKGSIAMKLEPMEGVSPLEHHDSLPDMSCGSFQPQQEEAKDGEKWRTTGVLASRQSQKADHDEIALVTAAAGRGKI